MNEESESPPAEVKTSRPRSPKKADAVAETKAAIRDAEARLQEAKELRAASEKTVRDTTAELSRLKDKLIALMS